MIFDLYLEYDFGNGYFSTTEPLKFRNEYFYKKIKGEEVTTPLKSGYISALFRQNLNSCYYSSQHYSLWVFGFAFTNNLYTADYKKDPKKLTAEDVLGIVMQHPDDFHKYLKGSFSLLIVNDEEHSITIVTDRLNLVPLYFAFEKNKLIISSNTSLILKSEWVNNEIDTFAMGMQHLFDYMLGEYYFVKGIRRCENATKYTFTKEGIMRDVYWDVSELYHKDLMPPKQSLSLLAKQLKDNVALYGSDSEKILLSLTGGFDGRTNLAMTDRTLDSYLCYSYGMPGSKQIRVPEDIARKLNINYQPIKLESEFLAEYSSLTEEATYFSNGTAPVGFCNIPYAFKTLQSYSNVVITGLFGSEILRPLHNNGIQVNDRSFDIFLDEDIKSGIEKAIQRLEINYFDSDIFTQDFKESLESYLTDRYFEKYKKYPPITVFFFFIIQEGIRKYFSQELSIERVFVSTRYPYFDTDLIDLVYKTPWAGMYNGFLAESKFKRRKGQLLYAYIIKKYKPELGKIKLDRGYTPNDLLLFFPINFLRIGMGVYKAKKYLRDAGGNDTFKTETWAEETLKIIADSSAINQNDLFGQNLKRILDENKHLDDHLTFRHMASIQLYFKLAGIR